MTLKLSEGGGMNMDDFRMNAAGFDDNTQDFSTVENTYNQQSTYQDTYNSQSSSVNQVINTVANAQNSYNEAATLYKDIKRDYIEINGRKINKSQYISWMIIPTIAIIAYYFSPIDLIPDSIPVIGTLDDYGVGYGVLLACFQAAIKKKTGIITAFSEVIQMRLIVANVIEHVVTSVLQMLTLVVGDIIILPLICAGIDCLVTLVCFYIVAYKYWPILISKVNNYQSQNTYNQQYYDYNHRY